MKILVEEKYIITRLKCDYEIVVEENVEKLDAKEKIEIYNKMFYACNVLNKATQDYYSLRITYKEIEKVGE